MGCFDPGAITSLIKGRLPGAPGFDPQGFGEEFFLDSLSHRYPHLLILNRACYGHTPL